MRRLGLAVLSSIVVAALPLAAHANTVPGTGCPTFPADNVWHADISGLPVHPSSAAWLASSGATGGTRLHPDFGPPNYGIPFNVVHNGDPSAPFTFDYASESDPGAYPDGPGLQVEQGSDAHMLAVNADTCRLYEIFAYGNSGPNTGGSGAQWDLNSNALRPAGWTSADAAGLPIYPGLLRPDEVAAGNIDHAIRFTVASTDQSYLWPARHQAGSAANPNLPPMGARFRLKASFDASAFSAPTRVVLNAMKHYGLILADNGSNWFFQGSENPAWSGYSTMIAELKTVPAAQFEAVDESSLMASPDSGQVRSPYVPPPPAPYHPVTPFRIFDSRSGAQFAPETAQAVQIAGAGVIPAGATAVVLNVGVTNTHGAPSGYVEVLPHGGARGTASTVNYLAGQTIASLTQIGLGAGYVDVFNSGGFADVFLDVEGYYGPATSPGLGLYNSLPTPARFLDTRGGAPLGGGDTLRLPVAGHNGVPGDAQAVVFNLTEVGGNAASYLAAWPDGQAWPGVSNLNFPAGRVLANRAIVTLGGGYLDIKNSQGVADVLVDVVGWYSGGALSDSTGRQFQPAAPTRLFDTRSGQGGHLGPLGPGESAYVGAPNGINGPVSVTVTALNASANSYLGVYPSAPAGPPATSDINFQPGDILPNLVVTAGNRFAVYNSAGAVDVFVDLTGSYV